MDEDCKMIGDFFERLYADAVVESDKVLLGNCPNCGEKLVFNNIHAEKYKEDGYLKQWDLYMK